MSTVGQLRNRKHSLNFNGATGTEVSISGLNVSAVPNSKATVEFWMKWTGISNAMPFGWTTYDLWLYDNSFGFNTGNGDVFGMSSIGLVNRWVFVSAIFNNGDAKLSEIYIDGIKQTLTQRTGATSNGNVTSNCRISGWALSSDFKFYGQMRDVRIWNHARTEQEIIHGMDGIGGNEPGLLGHWMLNEGTGLIANDSSSNAKHGVISGATWIDDTNGKTNLMLSGQLNEGASFNIASDGELECEEFDETRRPPNDLMTLNGKSGDLEICPLMKAFGNPALDNSQNAGIAGGGWSWAMHFSGADEFCEVADTDGFEGPRVFRIRNNASNSWKAFCGLGLEYEAFKWYRVSVRARVVDGLGVKDCATYLPFFNNGALDQWRGLSAETLSDGAWHVLYSTFTITENLYGYLYLYGSYGIGIVEYDSIVVEESDTELQGPPEDMLIGSRFIIRNGELIEGVTF